MQLIGGMALNDGRLAEMATGEGKTLVALLPTYLNALTGQSSFVVTTNDYLARRDGETMGQVFYLIFFFFYLFVWHIICDFFLCVILIAL